MRLAIAMLIATLLPGCQSLSDVTRINGPAYTQEELKSICERQRGCWHPDDLFGGYCEYRS